MSLFQLYFLTGDVVNSAIDHDVNLVVVDELDSIAHAFEDESFEKISTTEIVKKLIKISPKALLKLGKFI